MVVAGKNPDFCHITEKAVIELFGDYWHSPLRRPKMSRTMTYDAIKKHYKHNGYKCLIIWENELKNPNKVTSKIEKLMGGLTKTNEIAVSL